MFRTYKFKNKQTSTNMMLFVMNKYETELL